ncbi:GNAT family N-acetyltransferase [Halobaculum lipolyticum]|uniref:GNAT family N-acetyltransferase n=1 Tax=Halobaculum lipolyticum TaxID=3032001 RepID=A0ABD5W7P4_9EURY|nr:GNAT family N-acetyltransferase [Halobaculum sp. DT31]
MTLTPVDLAGDDTDDLLALFREYGWWDDRERDDVERALGNTDLAIGVREHDADERPGDGALVAAARVITDFVYYARVYDVIVARDRRGDGVGRALLESVVGDERLADVNPVLLCREGLVPFYESVGLERYPESVAVPDDDVDGEEVLATLVHATAGE